MTDNAVKTALEAEEKILSSEAERYLYEMREKAYYDYKSGMYFARQVGFAEGFAKSYAECLAEACADREEGIKLGYLLAVKELLGMKIPVSIICEGTGLSKEKVEMIRKCLMRKS